MNLWTVGCADPRLTAQARSPMDKRENAMRFPRLAHRSAAAHKLHSTPQQDRMNLISGNGETSRRLPAFSLSLPGSQTTGTVAIIGTVPLYWSCEISFNKKAVAGLPPGKVS